METSLYWLFLANSVIFLIHEMDGAYWKEWNMFSSTLSEEKGLTLYLLLHIPIILLLVLGFNYINSLGGILISFVFSLYIIFHFIVHMLAKKQGQDGFEYPVSAIIFFVLFFISISQLVVSTYLLMVRYIIQ